jgi:hypothetical protein
MERKTLFLGLTALLFVSFNLQASVNRIRITWSGDTATTAQIIWDGGSEKAKDSVLYFDQVDHGQAYAKYSKQALVANVDEYKKMFNTFVQLTGLEPDTRYYFVIKDHEGLSKRYWFETLPDHPNKRLSFISGGDSRNNRNPRLQANLLVSKLKAHAVFFGGDLTNSDSNKQMKNWLDDWQLSINSDGRITPLVVARGNHERSNSSISRIFGTNLGVYYTLNFGGDLFRAYTLNTSTSISGAQLTWFKRDVEQNQDYTWKFAQYHKPMRPHTRGKSEGSRQYKYWAPLFFDYNFDLVSESDSHTVKTTYPIRPSANKGEDEGFVRDDNSGTVYMGEGCWGAPLRRNNDDKSWTRASGRFNQFKLMFVDNLKIELRTIEVSNAKDVGEVSIDERFTLPANLKVWNPSNGTGKVITLSKRAVVAKVEK